MRFQKLDLNLLVALDALLTEKSVSAAADRICLSQSATSSALKRLRDYFEDDLLVQKGRGMVLTTRGEELIAPVKDVLRRIGATIAVQPEFDPATADRCFTMMATDYLTETLLAPAFREMSKTAPGIRFEISPLDENIKEAVERGMADILVTIEVALANDHPSAVLFEDEYVVVAWEGNPKIRRGIDADLYFDLGHVATKFGRVRLPSFEDWFVRTQSRKRRVEVSTPSFLAAPHLIIGTERVATMHRRLAHHMARCLPLKIYPLPFEMPAIRLCAQWHSFNASDRGIAWLIGELRRTADHIAETEGFPKSYPFTEDPASSLYQASIDAFAFRKGGPVARD